MTDRAYRLTSKSVTGETIQKDLDEAHMRIARINFILKQKGALSNDANKIIQSAQNMVTEMVLAAKRMRTTDSAFNRAQKRKRKKANRLVTHDSMPWSKNKRTFKDNAVNDVLNKIKRIGEVLYPVNNKQSTDYPEGVRDALKELEHAAKALTFKQDVYAMNSFLVTADAKLRTPSWYTKTDDAKKRINSAKTMIAAIVNDQKTINEIEEIQHPRLRPPKDNFINYRY